jgi:hypothetical protein
MVERKGVLWPAEYTEQGEIAAARRLFLEAIVEHIPASLARLDEICSTYTGLVGSSPEEISAEVVRAGDEIDFSDFGDLLDNEKMDGLREECSEEWTFEEWSLAHDPTNQVYAPAN